MANDTNDIVKIIDNRKVHLAIIDNSIDNESGLKALDIIRKQDKLMPCLLLAGVVNDKLLAGALKLNVCSVLAKPVNIVQAGQPDEQNISQVLLLRYFRPGKRSDGRLPHRTQS